MNNIIISGKVITEPELSHSIGDKNYWMFSLESKRTSGSSDIVRCVVLEDVMIQESLRMGSMIEVEGKVTSRKAFREDGTSFTDLFISVRSIGEYVIDINVCEVWGRVVKAPYVKETFSGKTLAQFAMISCQRPNGRQDFIPILAWGDTALEAAEFEHDDWVHVVGRFQSRYVKKHESTVCELSIPRGGTLERWEMPEEDI